MSQFRAVFALVRLALAVALLSTVGVVMLTAAQDIANPPGAPAGAAPTSPIGYRMAGADGSVYSFGVIGLGSLMGRTLNQPIVGIASTPEGGGYWLVARDGGIFAFDDAGFFGSTGNIRLNQPIVGMTSTPDGQGYWFVAADGGVFGFGDAAFFGSTGAMTLNQPIVGMAATPDGQGYWLVARDGGIFAFGDAAVFGSTGAMTLNQPIVGMAASPDGQGYWLVARDGGIFAFGDAGFFGSTGAITLNQPIVAMAATPSGAGYVLIAADGGVFNFGDAPFEGSQGGQLLAGPIVGVAPALTPASLAPCGACGLLGPINADRATRNLQPLQAFDGVTGPFPALNLTTSDVAMIQQREQSCAVNWDGTHCGGGENEATIGFGSNAATAQQAAVAALQEWFGEGPGGGHYANVMEPRDTFVMVAVAFHPNGTVQFPGIAPSWVVVGEFF